MIDRPQNPRPSKAARRTAKVVYWILAPTIFLVLLRALMAGGILLAVLPLPPAIQMGLGILIMVGAVVGSAYLVWKGWRSLCSQFE